MVEAAAEVVVLAEDAEVVEAVADAVLVEDAAAAAEILTRDRQNASLN